VGAIDCTFHRCARVVGEQELYYRGDKACHFISAQLIVTFDGRILEVALAKGHNNDQAVYKLTSVATTLQENNAILLADGGYFDHKNLVISNPNLAQGHYLQKFLRLMVEHINKETKDYEFARVKARCSIEFHQLGLNAIYRVVAFKLKMNHRSNLTNVLENLEARAGFKLDDVFSEWCRTRSTLKKRSNEKSSTDEHVNDTENRPIPIKRMKTNNNEVLVAKTHSRLEI
jgi:hypothetical protein